MMQPISQYNPNLHKGPSTSQDFNDIQNTLHFDLSQLFATANEHSVDIKENMDILIRENFFLQNKINELTTLLDKVKTDLLYKEQTLSKQQMIKSMYSVTDVVRGSGIDAEVDTLYGVLSLPESDSVSKVTYKATDNSIITPPSLKVSLMESNNTRPITAGVREFYNVTDDDLLRAFDGNNNTFWVHKSTFPDDSGINEVFGLLNIKLPLDIVNNAYVNTLTLHPYPEYSLSIADITYKGYDGTWYRLPNYPTQKDDQDRETPTKINNASKLLFSFPKIEVTEIQIHFSQPYWFANGNNREFVYGFQDIGVEYRVYNDTVANLVTEFSLEGTTKRFFTIEKPIVVPAVGCEGDIEDLVEHKLYYSRSLTSEFEFGNEILAPIQKVYVKTTIKSNGDVVPIIKDIKLDYVYKNLDDV
jgi:hypothetical protein